MMVTRSRLFMVGLLYASIVGAAGCLETDPEEDSVRDPGGERTPDPRGVLPDAGADATSRGAGGRAPAAVEVKLGRDIYVGVFKFSLGSAKLKRATGGALNGVVTVDFVAENLTAAIVNPFNDCRNTAPRLLLGNKTITASCVAPLVPAFARGEGSLNFPVDDANAAALSLPGAVLYVGDETSNQIEVPFAKLDETVGLANVPVTASFTTFPYRNTAVTLKRALVSYSEWSRNWLLRPEGKAHLLVEISVGAVHATSGRWSEADTTLLRPDGISVTTWLNEWIDVGYQKELLLTYEIEAPVSGTYTLTFGQGAQAVVQQLVVP